jgi:hypothetical protein
MNPEASQEPSNGPYPEPDNSVHTIPSKMNFNIIHTPAFRSSYGLIPSRFTTKIIYALIFSPLALHALPI